MDVGAGLEADFFGLGSGGLWGAGGVSVALGLSVPKRGSAVKANGADIAFITSPKVE